MPKMDSDEIQKGADMVTERGWDPITHYFLVDSDCFYITYCKKCSESFRVSYNCLIDGCNVCGCSCVRS
jgi:hypothetical protein